MINKIKKLTIQLRKSRSPLAPAMVYHKAQIDLIGKNAGNRETTDAEAIQYLKKAIQKIKELPVPDADEIQLLDSLLPQMATEQEVEDFLNSIDTFNKGFVMKTVKEHFGVLVDMKMVSELLKKQK